MMEITVSYDDLTRTLGKPVSDYGGTTLDANSTKITVTGIPDGYNARLDFDVSIRVEGSKKKVSPYLPLDADGSCIVPGTIMRACKADLRLPVQLVLESSDKTETYASKNWLIFRVSPSINAFETVQDAYEPDISKAFYKVEEEGGVIIFTRLDETTETVYVDDDFVAWKDVVSEWPEEPDDRTIPTTKLLDDTFLKSNLTAPNRLLITDGDGNVTADGPRIVTEWSPEPSDDNLPTERLVKTDLDTRALDSQTVHIDRGTPEWEPSITYHAGSTVVKDLVFYISQNDGNVGHDPSEEGTVWWAMVTGDGGGSGGDEPGSYRVFSIGDGVSKQFTINHGFNSYHVAHLLYAKGGSMQDSDTRVERFSKNHLVVTFHSPPAVDEWVLVAYRPGIGPESVVTSINGMSGDIELDPLDLGCVSVDPQELTDEQQAQVRENIGLDQVDNTSDQDKPISTAQQEALDGKVDKIPGKGLSTEDYTTDEKEKLAGIAAGAEVNVNADWNATEGDAQILNKPSLGTASSRDVGTAAGQIPVLDSSGKVPNSVLPSLAISEFVGTVTTKAQLVTLSAAQQGDWAQVTNDPDINNNGVYMLNGAYSTLANWIQIVGPGAVISVNGKTGVVTLAAADVGAVPTSRKVNNKELSADISLTPADIGAVPTSRTVNGKALSQNISLTPSDVGAVPSTRKVNDKELSTDIELTPADVGAVPDERTVNGKALSTDIELDADDVGAVAAVEGITGATHPVVTYGDDGLVRSGRALQASDIPNLPGEKITSGTVAYERLPTGNGPQKVVGVPSAGQAGQALRLNESATAYEWFTPSANALAQFTGQIVGDGATKVFTFNHGLNGTPDPSLFNSAGRKIPGAHLDADETTITAYFYTAPASGETYTVRGIA